MNLLNAAELAKTAAALADAERTDKGGNGETKGSLLDGPKDEARHVELRRLSFSWAAKGVPLHDARDVCIALGERWGLGRDRRGEVERLVEGAYLKLGREGKLPNEDAPVELRTLDLAACLTGTPEPIPWAIHGWLARRDVATLGGEPKTGKSWLALALALCAASGRPWLGTLDLEGDPLRVVYVDEEQSDRLVRYRLRRLAHGLGISAEELARLPILYLSGNGLRLDRPAHREALFRAVEEHRADLVLLDSLVRLHDADENSAREMSALYGAGVLPLSRQYGAAVLGLHHLTKPHREGSSDLAHRLRGSGDLGAVVDQLWGLDRGDGGHSTLRHVYTRWTDLSAPLDVQIHDTEDGLGVTVTAAAVSNVAETALRTALRDAGGAGVLRADLVAAVESAGLKSAVKLTTRYLGRWKADRTVRSEPDGRAVRYWLREHAPARLLDDEGTDQGTDEGTVRATRERGNCPPIGSAEFPSQRER